MLADPAVIDRFESNGTHVESGTLTALEVQVGSELARWRQVVTLSGLAPQEQQLAALDQPAVARLTIPPPMFAFVCPADFTSFQNAATKAPASVQS